MIASPLAHMDALKGLRTHYNHCTQTNHIYNHIDLRESTTAVSTHRPESRWSRWMELPITISVSKPALSIGHIDLRGGTTVAVRMEPMDGSERGPMSFQQPTLIEMRRVSAATPQNSRLRQGKSAARDLGPSSFCLDGQHSIARSTCLAGFLWRTATATHSVDCLEVSPSRVTPGSQLGRCDGNCTFNESRSWDSCCGREVPHCLHGGVTGIRTSPEAYVQKRRLERNLWEHLCWRLGFWKGLAMESRAGVRSSSAQIDLNLPPQLVQELTDSFKFFDRNGDGRISKEELGAVVRSLGQKVTDADLGRLMKDVDANGDGYIDLQEFIDLNARAIMECAAPMDLDIADVQSGMHDSMVSAFNVFDVDRDGLISAEELHRVLVGFGDEKVSLEDCRCMIRCVDEDGDQMVNFREFEALMSGTYVC